MHGLGPGADEGGCGSKPDESALQDRAEADLHRPLRSRRRRWPQLPPSGVRHRQQAGCAKARAEQGSSDKACSGSQDGEGLLSMGVRYAQAGTQGAGEIYSGSGGCVKCPVCRAAAFVVDTRLRSDDTTVRRRYECFNTHRFSTVEAPQAVQRGKTPKPENKLSNEKERLRRQRRRQRLLLCSDPV